MYLLNTRTLPVKICNYYFKSIQNKMTCLQKCFHQSTKNDEYKSIVVCGPSGSGKTTLLEKAIYHFNDKLKFSVSRMELPFFYLFLF